MGQETWTLVEEPKKETWTIVEPQNNPEAFGLDKVTSIGPEPRRKLFSKEGVRQYGGAAIKGIGKMAKGITELGPTIMNALSDIGEKVEENPWATADDVAVMIAKDYALPMAKGYAGGWKEMIKDPGKYLLEQPDQFMGNVFDVLFAGSGTISFTRKLNNARKLMAGKELTGAGLKAVIQPLAKESKTNDVLDAMARIPDEMKIKFPQHEAGAIYGEGGSTIGYQSLPVTKPTIPPESARMGKVSPPPMVAEFSSPLPIEGETWKLTRPKIKWSPPKQSAEDIQKFTQDKYYEMLRNESVPKTSPRFVKAEKISPTSPRKLEEWEVPVLESDITTHAVPVKSVKAYRPINDIPPESIIDISRAEALRAATPGPPAGVLEDLRQSLTDLSEPTVKAFEAAKLAFHSPDVIFYKHPLGKEIYDSVNASALAKDGFLAREANKLAKGSAGIKEGSLLSSAVFKAKDLGLTIKDVLDMGDDAIKHGFVKDELIDLARYTEQSETFRSFLSDSFDSLIRRWGGSKVSPETESKLWSLANANKKTPVSPEFIKTLTPTEAEIFDLYKRKIRDYIPHIFDQKEMVDFLGDNLKKAQDRLAKLGGTRMGPIYKKQVEELTIALEKAQRGPDNLLYQDLPSNIRFKFFEPRKGAEGYQVDAIKAYRTYLTGIAKKIFDEPVVRLAKEKYTGLPRELQAYTKWYLMDYMGYNRSAFADLSNGIKSLMWMKALGFNPRSAVVNWTQKLNTIADSNPIDSSKGYVMGFTKEGREAFERSGLKAETPHKLWEGTPLAHKSALDDVRNMSGFLFQAVENGNRKHAFLTGYYESLRKGFSEERAMANGIAKAEKTQFRYGKVGMPRALRGPTGVVFQFWSYPIKQLEFLGKLWREDPAKFFAWVALSEGANRTTQDFLGTDLSSALGLGVNWGELFTLVDNVAHGADAKQILYQLKKVPSGGGIFPYGLGPGIQTGQEGIKLATNLLSGAGIDTGDLLAPLAPAIIGRSAQAYSALRGGPDERGLYTVKSIKTGQPTYKETKADLAKRMFLGRPMVETKTVLETSLKRFKQSSYNDLVSEISDLYADGKTKEAFELMAKYKIYPTKESIKAAIERKALTRAEREKQKKPSKARYQYEKHLEERK